VLFVSQAVSETNGAATVVPPQQDVASVDKDARTWAMLAHLSALAGCIVPIPGSNLIGPIVIWQIKKKESAFVDAHGKEAVNFQLTLLIPIVISALLIFVLIGFPLLIAIGIAALVLTIIAALKANSGETYRYPLTIRFIK
jgi:uncharacterized Tic20 family protein